MRSLKTVLPWLCFGALLAGVVFFSLSGQPRNVDPSTVGGWSQTQETQDESELVRQVDEYLLELDSQILDEERFEAIHEFIRKTKAALWSSAYTSKELRAKLADLESAHAIKASAEKLKLSAEAEALGIAAQERGDVEEALRQLTIAADLQREVNDTFTVSPPRNHARFSTIDSRIRNLKAIPLEQESRELEQQALEAEQRGEWSIAADLYLKAYNLQMQINQQYLGTQSSNFMRSRNLLEKQKLADAGILFEGVEAKIREAEAAVSAGDIKKAQASFDDAEKEMIDLIEKYPANPFASRARLNDLIVRKENILAAPDAEGILRDFASLKDNLTKGNLESLGRDAAALHEKIQRLFDAYPNNTLISEDIRFEVLYLLSIRNDLTMIREQALQLIATEPDNAGNHWAVGEVSQRLYQAVMRNNPSLVRNPALPVNRVTLEEAREFCRRLSMILGMPVRLPRIDEYRALYYAATGPAVWTGKHSGNSAGQLAEAGSGEPGMMGVRDLVGNVAEWADGDTDISRQGFVAGGSIENDENEFRSLPVRTHPVRERSPVVGFRFLIEAPKQQE